MKFSTFIGIIGCLLISLSFVLGVVSFVQFSDNTLTFVITLTAFAMGCLSLVVVTLINQRPPKIIIPWLTTYYGNPIPCCMCLCGPGNKSEEFGKSICCERGFHLNCLSRMNHSRCPLCVRTAIASNAVFV
jgi:hypothetical protein